MDHPKMVYMVLFGIFMFIITSNFPFYPHLQDGKDTYFYMSAANMIINTHKIPWILHPISFLGLYPFSVPPGAETFLAELKLISGISYFDSCVIIMGDFLIFLAALLVFLLSLKINRNVGKSLIFAFMIITMPSFFNWNWNAFTSRVLFYILFLFFILFTYIIYRRGSVSNHALAVIIYIGGWLLLFTIHRTALLIFGVSTTSFVIFYVLFKFLRFSYKKTFIKISFFVFLIFALIIPFFNNFNIDDYNGAYYNNGFLSGHSPTVQLINFLISILGGMGVLVSLLLVYSILALFKLHKIKLTHVYALSLLGSLLLLSPGGLYIRCIIGIVALFVVMHTPTRLKVSIKAFESISAKQKILKIFITTVIIFILILNNAEMQLYWYNQKHQNVKIGPEMPESAYQITLYLSAMCPKNKSVVFDSWFVVRWVQSHSYIHALPTPPGMYTEINYVVYHTKNISAKRLSLWEFLTNPKKSLSYHYLYISSDIFRPDIDYINLMNSNWGTKSANNLLNAYNVCCVVNEKELNGKYIGWGKYPLRSIFFGSLSNNSYVIFNNDDFVLHNS